jgi:hypothetical protein
MVIDIQEMFPKSSVTALCSGNLPATTGYTRSLVLDMTHR